MDDNTVEIFLWWNAKTNEACKMTVPYLTDKQADICFEDIEVYFYRQGGQLRECKYCGDPFPYFPLGLNYEHCIKDECFKKHNEEYFCHIPDALGHLKAQKSETIPKGRPAPIQPKPRTKRPAIRRGSREGFVYLIRAENGRHKIGRARDVEKRRQSLEREIPMKMQVVHCFACSDYFKAELFLHEKYADRRIQYEWFDLSSEQIAEIIRIVDYGLD